MKSMDINKKWNVVSEELDYTCDLPHDVLIGTARDYSCALGSASGYFPARAASFSHSLPTIKSGKIKLVVSGACGYGDVFVNGERLGGLNGYAPVAFDLTGKLDCMHNGVKIDMFSSPAMADKYIGLGIAGGVKLVTRGELDIEDGSMFVETAVAGDKTYAVVTVMIVNDGEPIKLVLDCLATNSRGKRAGRKQRKIFMRAHSRKSFTVKVRITNPYEWSVTDPYMYGMTARILVGDNSEVASASTRFGIVSRSLSPARGLYINGKNTKLFGGYVSHADAALGCVSNYSNEVRRFTALKNLGYNAVHLVGCPTDATLDALDDVGMHAFVDIFSCLDIGKTPLDGHIKGFSFDTVLATVLALRNHPCVAIYGVADDVEECYGRGNGRDAIAFIAGSIRDFDGTRPVTVSAREFVPTVRELEDAGIRKRLDTDAAKINAGRERNLFSELTAPAFGSVDICGFNYLYPLYAAESANGKLILGSRTDSARAFESYEETEKNARVIGDFDDCAIDYPGGGTLNQNGTSFGDLDAICDEKPQGVYKRILLGARDASIITVSDPDTDETVAVWNWPRHLGQEVTVKVFTSGDVVALYLDGRLIGRKLAGKVNRHVATFRTEYYPGTLEAISYFKGVECSRTTLKTAASPKAIKLTAADKNLVLSRGDLGFVHVDVCDRDGNLVAYAMRELSAQVTGGEIVAFINADPMLRKRSPDTCPAYGGKAMLVIRPDESEDRAVVKITGDGLLAARITFKVKD